jgi:hypothetical protein
MKFDSFSYNTTTHFTITLEEVNHLLFLCEKHYDATCKSTGKYGGFIYGWKTKFWNNITTAEISATTHQLNLITKILEIEPQFDTPIKLSEQFNKLTQLALNRTTELNNNNDDINWIKFNGFDDIQLPKERRFVLVQIRERINLPACVVVGYLRYFSNNTPYFVCPGLDGTTWNVDFWCDCLGDNFNAPYWSKAKE